MTKNRERGENEITREADREAKKTGRHVCDILADWLKKAKADGDVQRQKKIERAQKYKNCRNRRKRT